MGAVESFADVDFTILRFPMITVYERPSDHPEKFVARLWEGLLNRPTDVFILRDTLDEIRQDIPDTMVPLQRMPNDEPMIVEVWI